MCLYAEVHENHGAVMRALRAQHGQAAVVQVDAKKLAAQGVGHPVLAWVMYMGVASMHVGLLPPPLGNFFNSEEPHVVLLNVIASLLLKLAKDNLIKLYDLANPAEDAARKVVDKLKAYSSRPAVVEAGVTEDWIQSFFLKQRPADAAPDDDGNESD